jgi:hypothetical protein
MKNALLAILAVAVIATIGTASAAKPIRTTQDFTTTEVLCVNIVASCDPAAFPGAPVDVDACVATIKAGPVPVGGFVGMTALEIFQYFFEKSMNTLGSMVGYCGSFVAVYPN